MNIVEKAREFAKARHEGQYRRGECKCDVFFAGEFHEECTICNGTGKVPYFTHLQKVASLVESDTEKAVAYLHDLIEDGLATEEEIKREFRDDIGDMCRILWKRKHESYDSYIYSISGQYHGAFKEYTIRVKIADIVANLSDNPTPRQIDKYNKALRILAGV